MEWVSERLHPSELTWVHEGRRKRHRPREKERKITEKGLGGGGSCYGRQITVEKKDMHPNCPLGEMDFDGALA